MLLLLLSIVSPSPVLAGEPTVNVAGPAVSAETVTRYDAVRTALLADQPSTVVTAATALAAGSSADPALAAAATAVARASDLTAARAAFAELSRGLLQRLAVPGAPKVVAYHCPMYGGFGYWIQPKSGIGNPYMGQVMPQCGEEVSLKSAIKAAGSAVTP